MRVKFTKDAFERPLGSTLAEKNRLFAEGDVQELPFASANRWIRRGVAVEVKAKAASGKASKTKK